MLEEQATVVALDARRVWLQIRASAVCGGCRARAGCGHGLMAEYFGRDEELLATARPEHWPSIAVGDRVRLLLPGHAALLGSMRGHGWPLLGLFGGAALGTVHPGGDPGTALGALLGLAGALLLSRFAPRRQAVEPRIEPLDVQSVAMLRIPGPAS